MPSCGHEDWPCCGCGPDLEQFDDAEFCQGCGEPENYCVCDQLNDEDDGDESMDGDHESGLASAGFGTDEDYMPGGYDDFGGDY
jgi:hypothetical protein